MWDSYPDNYIPKIRTSRSSETGITIMLESGSIAELDRMDNLIGSLKKDFDIELTPPVYWFCRIKARVEGRGDGSVLMQELCRICDENRYTIVDELNPYGRMTMKDLIKFNEKYGFKLCDGKSLMIRIPQIKEA